MHLDKIKINNFKNYNSIMINFSPEVNFIFGKNGAGKTNLLDAIYYLSYTKSALNNYVPTLVLIRNPLDTIISNHIYNFCRTNLSLEIKNYICYYNYIDRIKDKILLVNFETAIYEPNYVIKCLNKKFNLSFSKGIKKDIILQMEKEYKNESQHLKYNVSPIPSERRTNLKKQLFPSIKNNLYYPIAKDIYNSLQSTAI